jgi:hypothetical protein
VRLLEGADTRTSTQTTQPRIEVGRSGRPATQLREETGAQRKTKSDRKTYLASFFVFIPISGAR